MKTKKIAQILEPMKKSGNGFKGLIVTEKEIAEYKKVTENRKQLHGEDRKLAINEMNILFLYFYATASRKKIWKMVAKRYGIHWRTLAQYQEEALEKELKHSYDGDPNQV